MRRHAISINWRETRVGSAARYGSLSVTIATTIITRGQQRRRRFQMAVLSASGVVMFIGDIRLWGHQVSMIFR